MDLVHKQRITDRSHSEIIVKEITVYLEVHGKMNPGQYGFRSGRSCLSQLVTHQNQIIEALEEGCNIDVVYLDFAKVFDKVDHGILLHKVKQLGLTGRLGIWISNFLQNRQQKVVVNGTQSKESKVVSGVPQGSVLGPLLFIIHIADIGDGVEHSTVSSFADDTRIISKVQTERDTTRMQTDLKSLYRWADENNMKFNNDKFELIRYGKIYEIQENTNYQAHNGTNIDRKRETKDLGILMSDDATFKAHIPAITNKAKRQMFWILRIFETREEKLMLTLFKSLVIPLLEYCCQLWNPWKLKDIKQIEGIQRTFTNKITEINHFNYCERLKTLKLYWLERRRERYIVIYDGK